MSPATPHKRRIYYIDKAFQSKFIIQFCLLVALGSFIVMGVLYYLAQHSTTVAIIHGHVTVHTTADYLLPLLAQTILVQMIAVAFAAIVMTLYISHKIAGPLYRLKVMLKGLAQGEVSRPMRLREGDQLQEVAQEYTQAVSQLNSRIKKAQDAANQNDLEAVKKILETFKTS
jgi:methyl-accepting chemotaxis protein